MFEDDMSSLSDEQAKLIRLRPRSFARKHPALLQLGSKKPSVAYSTDLKVLLWDKLVEIFPDSTYHSQRIPGLSIGQTFREKYTRGNYPVEDFLPHIAIAFGKKFSFKDAQFFSMDELFVPDFSVNITKKVLSTLMEMPSPPGNFSRFSGTSGLSKMPMDSTTSEVFNVRNYLSEIQVAFDIVHSVEVAAPDYALADLREALFPKVPSLKSFADTVKSRLFREMNEKLNGLFATTVDFQGFDQIELGGNTSSAVNISWPNKSTRLFTPHLSIDQVQGFSFDLDVDVSDSGPLGLTVQFTLDAVGVNPIQTLKDIASRLSNELLSLSNDFEGLTSSLQSNFSNSSTLLSNIANSDRIQLLLDANIDLTVSMSLPSFHVDATLTAFDALLRAVIGKVFIVIVASIILVSHSRFLPPHFLFFINPDIHLYLMASNTRIPIDLISNIGDAKSLDFAGTFNAKLNVGTEDFPLELYASASSEDITNASSLDFVIGLDMDLCPLNVTLMNSLTN